MTEFEKQVLEVLKSMDGRLSAMEQRIGLVDESVMPISDRLKFLEQRIAHMDKSIAPIGASLPKLMSMVDDLHNDYLARQGPFAKEE